jgi:hypothetical protein
MTQPDHPAHLHLSRRHCDAVCKEIGERLSLALGPLSSELSPALLALIDELAKNESDNGNQRFHRTRPMKDFSNASFEPGIIALMTTAMRSAIATLPHPLSSEQVQSVAETILRTAKDGERDPAVLQRMALLELALSVPWRN